MISGIVSRQPLFSESMLAYGDSPSGSYRLRHSLATFFNERFSPITPVDRTQIIVTTGCSGVIDQLSWILADEGEGILIQRPVYGGHITGIYLITLPQSYFITNTLGLPRFGYAIPVCQKPIREIAANTILG